MNRCQQVVGKSTVSYRRDYSCAHPLFPTHMHISLLLLFNWSGVSALWLANISIVNASYFEKDKLPQVDPGPGKIAALRRQCGYRVIIQSQMDDPQKPTMVRNMMRDRL